MQFNRDFKFAVWFLAGIALALAFLSSAFAATSVNASGNVAWVAPVNDSNGVPLAGGPNVVTSYNVYLSTVPLATAPGTPTATVDASATTITGTITANVGDTVYAYVTACSATACSPLSSPGSKLVTAPPAAPAVPTSVTVTITVALPH